MGSLATPVHPQGGQRPCGSPTSLGPREGRTHAPRASPPWPQENDQKRIRALKKANKERELKKQCTRELAKAKQEMAALRLEHQRLSAKLQEYSIFNKYLEKVVENSEVRGGLRRVGGSRPTYSSPGAWALGGLGPLGTDGHLLWGEASSQGGQLAEAPGEAGLISQGWGPGGVSLSVCVTFVDLSLRGSRLCV